MSSLGIELTIDKDGMLSETTLVVRYDEDSSIDISVAPRELYIVAKEVVEMYEKKNPIQEVPHEIIGAIDYLHNTLLHTPDATIGYIDYYIQVLRKWANTK